MSVIYFGWGLFKNKGWGLGVNPLTKKAAADSCLTPYSGLTSARSMYPYMVRALSHLNSIHQSRPDLLLYNVWALEYRPSKMRNTLPCQQSDREKMKYCVCVCVYVWVCVCVYSRDIPQPAVIILTQCGLYFLQAEHAACFIQACYRKPRVNDHAIHGSQLTFFDSASKATLPL